MWGIDGATDFFQRLFVALFRLLLLEISDLLDAAFVSTALEFRSEPDVDDPPCEFLSYEVGR